MDASEEIPKGFHAEKKPLEDGEEPLYSTTQAVAVTKVLDDDNLLREIIVRVGFPTTLVHASLVCKRWLGHASDPKLLSHFRKLHPPHLLGYYITVESVRFMGLTAQCFVPMLPQPPELAAIIRLLESYRFGFHKIMECWNSRVFTKHGEGTKWTHGVHQPLCAEKGVQIIPPVPRAQEHNLKKFSAIVSKQEGSTFSYFYVLGESIKETGKSMVRVYMLQDGLWRMHTSVTCLHGLHSCTEAMLVDNKIYMPAANGDHIIVFDLTVSSLSTIQFPEGVKYRYFKSMLSRADDASSLYLFHVKEFQLCIWLHQDDNWLLVDTICLHEMLATLDISNHTLEDEGITNVEISQVGDNGQFVFLQMDQCIFYLDIKCRTLCKVYENTLYSRRIHSIHPFMMIWPPIFPDLKHGPARNTL